MQHDGTLNIATGTSAGTKTWKNKKIDWSELVARLSKEHKTNETYKEFISAPKEEQQKIKDVGGYVGGYLRNGRRKPENVVHRQILTLDLDFANLDFWDDVTLLFSCAVLVHGTHKHSNDTPRYRLIMPLSREVTPDEYVAVSRKIAGILDIDAFDDTTFETNRLMFWPSISSDSEYFVEHQDGPWLDADQILNSYIDWTDSSLWPVSSRKRDKIHTAAKKQQDPTEKRGLIGAFCRAYTIPEAIETFLSDSYAETSTEGRYTYTKGSTSGGLTTYEDKFAFSHHGTDPSSGKLCNAFDLVRIHKYGHLDTTTEGDVTRKKSYKEMEEFARVDPKTKQTIAAETIESAKYEFKEHLDEQADPEEQDLTWTKDLDVDGKGKYLSTASNLNIILANDDILKGLFHLNTFDNKRYLSRSVPWRKITKPDPIKNVDYSGVRNYIETVYGIAGNLKIDDAVALEFEQNSFHPVRSYLNGLAWDSTPRVDKLLSEYLGAEDNVYTREAMRKTLVAAVARVFKPGVKFDLVLTLVGKQGVGKSTFIRNLGREWFSDSFNTVSGKESFEQLQGAWVIEMAELAGLRKAEVESIKHFLSKQEDTFRPAYGRVSETYRRQCVFIGTTNSKDFLKDPSGNRRFMPISISKNDPEKNVFDMPGREIAQIWAEAVQIYKAGEKLYLSSEAEKIARQEQERHSEKDERTGIIEEYINKPVPENWDKLSTYQRRAFLAGDEETQPRGTVYRDRICVAEIWVECLGRDKSDMDRYKTREINEAMRNLPGWVKKDSVGNFPPYGKQRYYKKLVDDLL
jgi:predicted P-loop ATPase